MAGSDWAHSAGDYASARHLYMRPWTYISESYPRDVGHAVFTPTTSVIYLAAVPYQKGQLITSIGYWTGTTAAGTPTNQWTGIYQHDFGCWRPTAQPFTIGVTNASTNVTGTGFSDDIKGRYITAAAGFPANTFVKDIVSSTQLTLSAAFTGTTNAALAATVGAITPRAMLRQSADGTTGAIAAGAQKSHTLSATFTIPATGLYWHAMCVTATTLPTVVAKNVLSAVGVGIHAQLPAMCGTAGTATTPASAANPLPAITSTIQPHYTFGI